MSSQAGTGGPPVEGAMVDEFDTVARWTADAVTALGPETALPAACRGSGSPAALDWLVRELRLTTGDRLLDSGAGIGGPSALAATRHAVRPVLVDPMPGACRAADRLFGHPVAVADGAALPFADDAFDAVWSLGVLCSVPDQPRHLAEMVRCVAPGGPVGLLVFVRQVAWLDDEPQGNTFPSEGELAALLDSAQLTVQARARVADFEAAPDDWEEAADRVETWIDRHHGHDERRRAAQAEQQVVKQMIASGRLIGELLACRSAAPAG